MSTKGETGMKKLRIGMCREVAIATILASLAFAAAAVAQDTTTQGSYQSGSANVTTEVKSGEVLYVSGNDLVVKTDDGQVKHFVVSDDRKIEVDGKQLTVHDLTPGMRLTRTITTTSVPKTVTTVRTINGKVWFVNAPSTVILTLPDNTNKQYKVPKDQTFMVDGQKTDVFGLRKGMTISATVVTESPLVETSSARAVTGEPVPAPPPPPPTPAPVGALLIEDPTPAPAPQQVAQASLPKTGSSLPLIGLLGMLCIGAYFSCRAYRA
jgi:hypothetical protein